MKDNELYLRALESEDLNLVFEVENSRESFLCGDTRMPYSYAFLREYIQKSLKETFLETGQVRLMVGTLGGGPVGILDLFNHDPFSHRAELGVIVLPEYRRQGYGKKIMELACNYARNTLHLHQLYAEVLADNTPSLKLFEEGGFARCALKRDWFFTGGRYVDVVGFQRVLE